MRILVLLLLIPFCSLLKAQEFKVNDSLDWHLATNDARNFVSKFDSANQLLLNKELAKKLQEQVVSILYRDGVAYFIHSDSAILFYVDLEKSKSKVTFNGKKIKKGMSEKKFKRKFKALKKSKIDVKKRDGSVDQAYTLFKDEKSGISYRAIFRKGKITSVIMYHP